MARDGRVLVVDPDPEAVAATLEGLAVTTVSAPAPDEARSPLDDRTVDCVVTELRFERPDAERGDSGDGLADWAFLADLRERDPTLPVVVYTDADLASLDPTALAGTTACIPKGADDARIRLREWVERAVDARTRERDRLAGVVHDLRNPLRAANVSLARLRRDLDAGSEDRPAVETQEHLTDLAATHERLGTLLDDLDALCDAGRPVVDTDPVDLADVASEAWRTLDTRGASLRVETGATLAADRRKLRRLLENLLANAVEHGGGDARADDLTVTVGPLDDDTGFYVADDGPGIPSKDREVVFERGYSTVDGTGYGLAIVAELAAAHGWSVAATESESGGARIEART